MATTADEAVTAVINLLAGIPAAIAGSVMAAQYYGKDEFSDVDVFCYTPEAIILAAERLRVGGAVIWPRHERMLRRWHKYELGNWHTNSIKFHLDDIEINLIYKTIGRHPVRSSAQVIESFDFGLLHMAYDLDLGAYRSMCDYFFPGADPRGALPMLPDRREQWQTGFVSQYVGMRQFGRYAKYAKRGYDLSLVKPDLITGYELATEYHLGRGGDESMAYAQVFESVRDSIEDDRYDDLIAAAAAAVNQDSLDTIMESLE